MMDVNELEQVPNEGYIDFFEEGEEEFSEEGGSEESGQGLNESLNQELDSEEINGTGLKPWENPNGVNNVTSINPQIHRDKVYEDMFVGQINPYTGREIKSEADYLQYKNAYDEELAVKRLEQAGLDVNAVNEIINNNPTVLAARQIIEQSRVKEGMSKIESEINELRKDYPSCGLQKPADLFKTEFNDVLEAVRKNSGLSVSDCFFLCRKNEILQKNKSAATQSAINNINSKSHLSPSKGTQSLKEEISIEVLNQYKMFFPDWSDAQIRDDYKKR